MKKLILPMNINLFSALLIGGCRVNDPVANPAQNTDYSIIDGDTIKTVVFKDYKKLKDKDPNGKNYIIVGDTIVLYKKPKLHTPPAKDPDLSKLKNNDDPDLKGKPLRYVAIGGSLTAGVRDGGYFNEGILTSYPNLIAQQMKLKKFEQPLFDATDYNGFGRKVRTGFNPTGGPVPKFNEVKNNSGVESVDEKGVKLKAYKVKESIDNFAIPNFSRAGYMGNFINLKAESKKDKEAFYNRIVENERIEPIWKKIVASKADILTVELRQTEVMNIILGGNDVIGVLAEERDIFKTPPYDPSASMLLSSELLFLRKLEEQKGLKVILLNVPDFSKLPYNNMITPAMVNAVLGNSVSINFETASKSKNSYDPTTDLLLPSSPIDSLLSPKVHISLKKGVYDNPPIQWEGSVVRKSAPVNASFNKEIEMFSKRFGYPIADIRILYDKVINGSYISNDGLKVSAKDFFSDDNIYPSALGQACIANEIIKTLNNFYKTDIPFIALKEYQTR
ncbi:hypothetical protein GCM10027035_00680 [Emticicia sediminis]